MVDVPMGFEQCLTCDPKDRHVRAGAIVGGCRVIVTQNTKEQRRRDHAHAVG